MKIVAGDIGGTHARFAIAELTPGAPPVIGAMHKYRTREHPGIASAWAQLEKDCGASLPKAAAFGIAAPIEGDHLRFVNSHWEINRWTVQAELGLDHLLLLNDFGAVGNAVSVLPPDALLPIAGPATGMPQSGVTTIMGPGTGLGVSMLARRAIVDVIETEGAHISFAPQSDRERALEAHIRGRYGRCSVERIVSGPGLVETYAFLGGGDWDVLDAGTLWQAAIDGSDPMAVEALDILVGCFGAAAGDIALAHGAMSLVITGGLANRMQAKLGDGTFHARFVDKGRYKGRMERIPVMLSTYDEPGLLGAAVALQRELAV